MPNPTQKACLLLGVLGLGMTTPVWADQLADLVKSGKIDKAYALAQSQAEEREGTPEYDLLLAKILIAKREFGQASFALERAIIADPASTDARITQAELLVEQKRYTEAIIILEKTKAANAEQRVRSIAAMARANEEMKALPKENLQSGFKAYVEFGLGYDDNFNYGTDSQTVQLANGQTLVLGPAFAEQSTSYARAKVGGSAYKQISPKATLVGYASAELRNNQNDPLDSTGVLAGAGYVRNLGKDGFATYVNYSLFESDRSKFRDTQGLLFQYFGPGSGGWNAGWNTTWTLAYNMLNYAQSSRDADQYQVGYGMTRSFTTTRHSINLFYVTEDSDAGISADERDIISISYKLEGLNGLAGTGAKPYLSLIYANTEEGGPRTNFAEAIDTDAYTVGLGLKLQKTKSLSFMGEIGFYEADSNVSIYDVSRSYVELGLRYEFD